MLKFNKEQREGFARFCDTLAATALVGAIIGIAGYSQISRLEISGLFLICFTLLVFGYFFRRNK